MKTGKKEQGMKKRRILLGVVIAALLVATLAACGGETVHVVEIPLSEEQFAFCVNKADAALLAEMNAFLAEIQADGRFDEICNRYFGNDTPRTFRSATADSTKRQLVVATSTGFSPFEMVSANGEYSGIDLEIAHLFAEETDREIVIVDMQFESVVTAVESGLCDIGMAGLTITADRAAVVEFTKSYYNAAQVLVVCGGDDRFADATTRAEIEAILADLPAGTRVGCQKGTTGETYIVGDKYNADGSLNANGHGFSGLPAEKASYDYGALAITAMCNGDVDFVILDDAPAEVIAASFNGSDFGDKVRGFCDLFFTEGGWVRVVTVGLKNTLLIAVLGLCIGVVIGTMLAIAMVMPKYRRLPRILDRVARVYVGFFRGTPIVVQLLLAYYVLLPLIGLRLPSLTTCIAVFGLNSAAYVAEIMRSGIGSVDRGQMEAGRALGLSYATTMYKIVVPQAVKNILPTLGNEFIALVKDTSVVSFVAAVDIYKTFTELGNVRYEYLMPYLAMAVLYIVLVGVISLGVKYLERRLQKNER